MAFELSAEVREQAKRVAESFPPLSPHQRAVIATVLRPALAKASARPATNKRRKTAA